MRRPGRPVIGNPSTGKTSVSIAFRVSPDMAQRLEAALRKRGLTRGEYLRSILETALS